MSREAPPERPGARAATFRGVGRAAVTAAIGGAAAFGWLVVACELVAIASFFLSRRLDLGSWMEIGLLTSLLSLGTDVGATIAGIPGVRVPTQGPIDAELRLVPMLLTLGFLWLASRAGRRAAERREGRSTTLVTIVAAAGAAIPVAGFAGLAASVVSLRFPGIGLRVSVDAAEAVTWGFVLAAVAAATGAFLASTRGRALAAPLRGGLVAYGWALLLLGIGVLILAALEPRATRAYVDLLEATGSLAPAAFGSHLLLIPAQSAVLLAPAAGTCVDVVVGSPAVRLCAWTLEAVSRRGQIAVREPITLSFWLWLLSAVPALAAFLGGRWAAIGAAGRRAVALGAGAGAVFAVVALAGAWFALPDLFDPTPTHVSFVTLRPTWVPTALALLGWGVVGGAVGGWVEGRRSVRAR